MMACGWRRMVARSGLDLTPRARCSDSGGDEHRSGHSVALCAVPGEPRPSRGGWQAALASPRNPLGAVSVPSPDRGAVAAVRYRMAYTCRTHVGYWPRARAPR
jgi:hypothetical protein